MRSALYFFMLENDENEFITNFEKECDFLDKSTNFQWFFNVGDCPIQYYRCKKFNNILTAGRISIATTGFDLNYKSSKLAEKKYNMMRRWIKNIYSNKMTSRNVNIENSTSIINDFWVSQTVINEIQNSSLILKQFKDGYVVFDIQNKNDL